MSRDTETSGQLYQCHEQSPGIMAVMLYTHLEICKCNLNECVYVSERNLTLEVFVRLQGCAAETEYRSQGFQWQQLGLQGMRSESTLEMCPPLTCLHTRDAGGVKHPLPLSRTQRNLVCQQVYLMQRPKQQLGKTVEQRHWTWVCHTESTCIRLCQEKTHTKYVHTTCCTTGDRVTLEGSGSETKLIRAQAFGPKEYKTCKSLPERLKRQRTHFKFS